MSRNSLSTSQELQRGEYLISNNGNFKAIMQDDGNFVLYTWKPVWASNTCGKPGTRLVMQADGNLVIYNDTGNPLWASDTWQNKAASDMRLTLKDDGSLVITEGTRVLRSLK
ncbi:B-type lectin plumieribetin-like [Hoplias malabaricus]|uniref:B-type lectin plumieribetin-like n=1 Tax=Hoplias malabaricus TaxID=27720 RepID=UPI0034618B13